MELKPQFQTGHVFRRWQMLYMKRSEYIVLITCADKSLALPTSRCILFDGENISFDASLVLYIYI